MGWGLEYLRLHTTTSNVTKNHHIAQAHADNIVLYALSTKTIIYNLA